MEREPIVVGGVGPIDSVTFAAPSRPAAPAPEPDGASQPAAATGPVATALRASGVALAPASMAALIEAQERLADRAPTLQWTNTAQKLDQLITRLADGDPPPPADSTFTVRRLAAARVRLTGV
jgi:hypothetical protein